MYRGRSLLRHAAETALATECRPVVVVLGASAEQMETQLTGLPIRMVLNPRWSEGISSSLRAGIEAAGANPVLFTLCDQPLVTSEMLNRIVKLHGQDNSGIVASEYEGTIGVPALFSPKYFRELAALTGDCGAKKIILRFGDDVARVPMPEAAFDVDRMEHAALLGS
jgi:molybdenum cofactor cytidylyltransferase